VGENCVVSNDDEVGVPVGDGVGVVDGVAGGVRDGVRVRSKQRGGGQGVGPEQRVRATGHMTPMANEVAPPGSIYVPTYELLIALEDAPKGKLDR